MKKTNMNLSELKAAVAKESGLTQDESDKAIKSVFAVISKTLSDGDSISIPGFGSWSVSDRAAHTGRNPCPSRKVHVC
jgi:DNA-binding protein HU-beta